MRPPTSRLTSPQRRAVLKAAASFGLLAAVERNFALAQSASGYKALVCVFQEGGNDGENTLVRFDAAGYQNYATVRPSASGLNIPRTELLPVQPLRGGPAFGFHPACGAMQTLFEQKQLAVIANVGMLAMPSTKAGLETQGAARPANLFSHPDQQRAISTADHSGIARIGWGGRIADRLASFNAENLFPPVITTDQWGMFASGRNSVPLNVPAGATLQHASTPDPQADALAEATLRQILGQPRDNIYDAVAQLYAEESLASSSVASPILLNPSSLVRPAFARLSSGVAQQLLNVALMIEGRAQTSLRRQVFFVRHAGYDTHGGQPGLQRQLLGDLAQAMLAFQEAMAALGLGERVTTFTLSDFGRTFKPAAGNGTDHGWGNYAFVAGGAVKGGDFYGTLPVQALNGPDDLGNAGRWIPTTSIEQYGATLCRWFGIAEDDLPYVFPNIGAFANTNLGFMA